MRVESRLKRAEEAVEKIRYQCCVIWDPWHITEEQRAAIRRGDDVVAIIWEGDPTEEEEQKRLYKEAGLS